MLARGPQRLTAGAVVDVAVLVVAVVERNAALRALIRLRQANGVFIGRRTPAAGLLVISVAQHGRLLRLGELGVVVAAGRWTALRQIHLVAAVEDDVGDADRRGRTGDFQFDARIGAEVAFVVYCDRPNGRPLGHGIIEAARIDGEAEHAAALIRITPGRRVFGIERTLGDVHAARRIVVDWFQALGRASGDAVIEHVAFLAVEREAMDHAGLEIRDEELPRARIERDVAERGSGVLYAIEFDGRKQRYRAGLAVDLVDRARCAGRAGAELAGHPLGTVLAIDKPFELTVRTFLDDLQPEHRGCRDVGVGGLRVVESNAVNLSGFTRLDLQFGGNVGQLPARRGAELGKIEQRDGRAVGIDEGAVQRMDVGRNVLVGLGARKARHERVALADNSFFSRLGGVYHGAYGQSCCRAYGDGYSRGAALQPADRITEAAEKSCHGNILRRNGRFGGGGHRYRS